MITTHPAYARLKELAEQRRTNIHEGNIGITLRSNDMSNCSAMMRSSP